MKATHCGQENRSSDPGQGVRNEIIAVMERFAASGCSFFCRRFETACLFHLQGLILLLYLNPRKPGGHPVPKRRLQSTDVT